MPLTFIVENIPPAKYVGYHKELTAEPDCGLSARRTAIDYSGQCEVFARRCELFSHLGDAIPQNIRSVTVAAGNRARDYSGWELTRVMDDINDKVTQWIAVVPAIVDQARHFETQVASAPASRFEFYAPVRQLESHVEHYCFKIVSILDLYARLARVFNRKSPDKFGQQVASTKRGEIWDRAYQDCLLSCDALAVLRDYRNVLGHEASLKLRPLKSSGTWVVALVENHHDTKGLLLSPFLDEIRKELLGYAEFVDRHFAAKAGALRTLACENAL